MGQGTDIGTNLIDGHVIATPGEIIDYGTDIGTNLIDGHWERTFPWRILTGYRHRHQSDRRTRLAVGYFCAILKGTDIGTNLIDGHFR